MHEKEYNIKFYEVDFKNQLKETVLLNFLQDIAADSAEQLGFGYSFISKKNLGWFLLKYHIKVYNWPCGLNKIVINTWPKGINKLSCLRDFEVYDDKGEKIAAASSSWVLTDLINKKLALPGKVLDTYSFIEKDAFETNFPKIPAADKISFEKKYEVRYDDIDINQHVNNANYLGWALDTLSFDFRTGHSIKEIEIHYKKEMKFGSKVLSVVELDLETMTTIHNLKHSETNDDLCFIRIRWN